MELIQEMDLGSLPSFFCEILKVGNIGIWHFCTNSNANNFRTVVNQTNSNTNLALLRVY